MKNQRIFFEREVLIYHLQNYRIENKTLYYVGDSCKPFEEKISLCNWCICYLNAIDCPEVEVLPC